MYLPDIKIIDVKGKRVFLRMDLDAPVKESRIKNQESRMEVSDDTRLVVGMPTLKYLLSQEAQVIVGGHLRMPDGYDPKLSVRPIVEWIFNNLKIQDSRFKIQEEKNGGFGGWKLSDELFILENLRFYKEEKTNNEDFAKKLASLAEIYINDAFASSHRNHASITGITKFLPHYAGFHIQKEIQVLSSILENPKRPLVVIIGGEKIDTKLPLVSKMCQLADNILVGGKIAQEMGKAEARSTKHEARIRCAFLIGRINDKGTDITLESIEEFIEVIKVSKTIIWNGPVGKISPITNHQLQITKEDNEYGTWRLANAIVESGAYTVAGGGDTLEFLKQAGLLSKFSFFSTGGGAMLSFLSGEKLPGIEALLT